MIKTVGKETTLAGSGKWRIVMDKCGDIISVELWADDPALRGVTYSYEVIDIKPR